MTTHENLRKHEELPRSSDRSFGFVFAGFFTIVGLWPLLGDGGPRYWSIALAAIFLAVSLIRPKTLAPLNVLWGRFGLLLHKIVNPIVMGLIFFFVVTPIGLVMRAMGKDLLKLKRNPAAKSYWIERRPPGPPPETMRQQF